MKRNIVKLVDISNDDARYVADMRVDYIVGDNIHFISEDENWEINFDWKEFIPALIHEIRQHAFHPRRRDKDG